RHAHPTSPEALCAPDVSLLHLMVSQYTVYRCLFWGGFHRICCLYTTFSGSFPFVSQIRGRVLAGTPPPSPLHGIARRVQHFLASSNRVELLGYDRNNRRVYIYIYPTEHTLATR
ncbi:unnamed protein product, partial [Laminaria digitata]